MENEQKRESSLDQIRVSDFRIVKPEFEAWTSRDQELPAPLLDFVESLPVSTDLESLFHLLDSELKRFRGDKRDAAVSFADSRFTSISEMLERGMVSCGALTKMYAGVLSKLGVPVKLVHAVPLVVTNHEDRHAWIEVPNPAKGTWVEVDPTQPHRRFGSASRGFSTRCRK